MNKVVATLRKTYEPTDETPMWMLVSRDWAAFLLDNPQYRDTVRYVAHCTTTQNELQGTGTMKLDIIDTTKIDWWARIRDMLGRLLVCAIVNAVILAAWMLYIKPLYS